MDEENKRVLVKKNQTSAQRSAQYTNKSQNTSTTPIDQIKQIKCEPIVDGIEYTIFFDDSASSV